MSTRVPAWVRPPSARTLDRYGLTAGEWIDLFAAQGFRCGIRTCAKRGAMVTWNTDHQHVPGWKNLEPEERKRFVRGILCAHCNHRRVHSHMGSAEAQAMADYFKAYEARRDA